MGRDFSHHRKKDKEPRQFCRVLFNEKETNDLVAFYEAEMPNNQVYKFVPASGAASRMFKSLFAFLESYDGSKEALDAFEKDQSFPYLLAKL